MAHEQLKKSGYVRRILSLPKLERNRRTGSGAVDAMAEAWHRNHYENDPFLRDFNDNLFKNLFKSL